jgi:hypothetical protein
VYLHDLSRLYAYSLESNSYQQLSPDPGTTLIDYHMTAAIDPKRRKFVIVGGPAANGGGVTVYDIGTASSYTPERWSTTGGETILNAASPGLAYDPVSDRMVAWHGGGSVYLLDLDARAWSVRTLPGGPGGAAANGTFGRWDYVPALGVFVTVSSVDDNARVLRLGSPAVEVDLEGTQFRAGEGLTLTVRAESPADGIPVDLHAGVVLPDGDTVLLVTALTGAAQLVGSPSPAQFVPLETIMPGSSIGPRILPLTLPAGLPPGIHDAFVAAVRRGGTEDDRIDPGDVLSVDLKAFEVVP